MVEVGFGQGPDLDSRVEGRSIGRVRDDLGR